MIGIWFSTILQLILNDEGLKNLALPQAHTRLRDISIGNLLFYVMRIVDDLQNSFLQLI